MALLVFAPAAAVAGVIAPEFWFSAAERLCRHVVVLVMSTIGAVHVRFGRFGFGFWHNGNSGSGAGEFTT